MYQIKEIESLIKIRKPRYLNRFNRISARWQSKLQKYQEEGKLSEYVEYSDKIKNHIGRIKGCIDMQRGGMVPREGANAGETADATGPEETADAAAKKAEAEETAAADAAAKKAEAEAEAKKPEAVVVDEHDDMPSFGNDGESTKNDELSNFIDRVIAQ